MRPVLSPCCQRPLTDAMFVTALCSKCYTPVSLHDFPSFAAGDLGVAPWGVVMEVDR